MRGSYRTVVVQMLAKNFTSAALAATVRLLKLTGSFCKAALGHMAAFPIHITSAQHSCSRQTISMDLSYEGNICAI
jgi:hypothetical protein